MASSSRKRKAESQWELPATPKSPRLLSPEASSSVSSDKTITNSANWSGRARSPLQPLQPATASPSLDIHKPAVLHPPHPDSKLCQDFHWVPYPLGLMAFDSRHNLHHREDTEPSCPFRCPVCREERKVTPHMRKVFLVAERLTWDDKLVSIHDKDLNEELVWKVNFELGILDPFVEDPEQVRGGKHSRSNKFHPYQNEHEMKLAFKLIFMTENLNEATWMLWISTQLHLERILSEEYETNSVEKAPMNIFKPDPGEKTRCQPSRSIETIDLTESPEPPSTPVKERTFVLPTRPSPSKKGAQYNPDLSFQRLSKRKSHMSIFPEPVHKPVSQEKPSAPRRIESYKSLQDFYSLLDRIERTSYVGAVFLEAYAERLRGDMCKNCWMKHNVIIPYN